ncbi:alpha/beta hydrolase [Streptomyces sp. NPDC048290]|uniref:alpha/beta fold hydrolase n=1 Tax=Streptomyces sp. NPDC048290 TaxID=3155811 RepID=UPI0034403C2C
MGPLSPRRRISAAALALSTGVLTAVGAPSALAATAGGEGMEAERATKPTVVLVHGAFADASGWNAVVKRLTEAGFPVVAPPNPLRGVLNDSAQIASVLKSIKGPIILAGHSYGGAVISQAAAGNSNVKALIYVSAFMPDVGESPAALSTRFAGSELGTALRPVPYTDAHGSGVDLYLKDDKFHEVFAADLPKAETRLMAVEQRPVAEAGFAQKATAAAWKSIPSWFVVARNDKAIAPDLERFEAQRAKSRTVEVDSSHVAMMSHPDVVTQQITDAARDTTGAVAKAAALAETGTATRQIALTAGAAGALLVTGGVLTVLARRRARRD